MMISYQSLSLLSRSIILVLSLILTTFFLLFLSQNPNNTILQIITFLLIFSTLYVLFNYIDFKIYNKIFMGLTLGIIAGLVFGEQIQIFQPVGQAFIKLIKMIVIPLVFASLLVGTASMNNIKKLGNIGVRTFVFYIISTALAITLGLIIANTIKPGSEIPVEVQNQLKQDYELEAGEKVSRAINRPTTVELLLNIIPENPARSMADARMLQIIFFALICGVAITYLSEDKKDILLTFFDV